MINSDSKFFGFGCLSLKLRTSEHNDQSTVYPLEVISLTGFSEFITALENEFR